MNKTITVAIIIGIFEVIGTISTEFFGLTIDGINISVNSNPSVVTIVGKDYVFKEI